MFHVCEWNGSYMGAACPLHPLLQRDGHRSVHWGVTNFVQSEAMYYSCKYPTYLKIFLSGTPEPFIQLKKNVCIATRVDNRFDVF